MTVIHGIVKDGRIEPDSPLPEGTRVEISLVESKMEFPPELQAELEDWQRASARTIVEFEESLEQEGESR